MEFVMDNYIWFIVGGIVILMAVIGYFADKSDFGRKKFNEEIIEKPKKEKKQRNKEEKPTKIEVDAKGIGELSQSVIENNLKEQSNVDSIKENNEDIDQSLFAPLENPGQEDKAPNDDSNVVEEVIENHDDDPKTVTDLNPIEPTTLNVANDSNNQSTSDDDDIWKF